MAKSIQLKNSNNENIYPYALLKEFVLYNDDTGSNGTITLTDNVSNYKYIEIFYRNNDKIYNSVKVYQANNKVVWLSTGYISENNVDGNIKYKTVDIKNNTISTFKNIEVNFNASNRYNYNYVFITRVVGYK